MANVCPCTFGNSVSSALFGLRDVKKLNCEEPEKSSPATVLSRTVQRKNEITNYQESPWLYLVTFRLETGDELALKAAEESYKACTEGAAGELHWQGETLISFQKGKEENL